MIRRGTFDKTFLNKLNEANYRRDNPHLLLRLVDNQRPIVASKLTEYPPTDNPTRRSEKLDLEDVISDFSDMNPNAVDLDTDPSNLAFLQKSIKNLVMRDTQLGESNINVSEGAQPKLPPAKQYFEPTITGLQRNR